MTAVTATKVLFPEHCYQSDATVQLAVDANGAGCYIVTDQTPFHPVSHIWPDHPADQGTLVVGGIDHPVLGCHVGAVELATGKLLVGSDIFVKRGTEGWVFVVVHHIGTGIGLTPGTSVHLQVDAAYQQALSRGHSGGHLSSLALNKVLHEQFWRKDASRKDELGHYDFHSYAQSESRVTEDLSTDTYRLGKTLRKRGFNTAEMLEALPEIEQQVNFLLAQWCDSGAPVVIRREGEALTDSRYWQCDLGEGGVVEIPCGGTHVTSLAEYAGLEVSLVAASEQELVMLTKASVA
ncbi:metal-dependent hydrolase [Photobacterium aquae]|uniref:Metal-dependent hydrolase n=1 Tax=Photobacterium aquae TaxID=1195763 RepID=A0A0J1H2A8_9GAMM|nr:metal-dependent hydrolase [Photobacterium aquae]KLV05979.1 metal-dependent hydrolase [Photobacterium aquae]